eukprot:COSAG05_NODE_6_length_45604_cov_26.489660_9_plen_56_part_00
MAQNAGAKTGETLVPETAASKQQRVLDLYDADGDGSLDHVSHPCLHVRYQPSHGD